ncbi:MAG: exodeoxyribonuclease III [Eubacteriales bacterium]|nr:exodeoxyribonuclease III [Eubacteriales bacterium]
MKKLISWNVNGLRACVQKGFLDYFKEANADIFCIQESKLQEGQIHLELPGYFQYWNYAVKKGYSGTAVFTKEKAVSVKYGMGIEQHDQEGRVITLEYENYYVVTVYTPNSQQGLARLSYRMEWEEAFREYLKQLESKNKPLIICGDLNVAATEQDIKNPKSNVKNAGFTPEEREKFQQLLQSGFVDTFRFLHPETEKYSWWSYRFKARERNAGWRIDYFLASASIKDKIKTAEIHTEILGSDHCPVSVEIDF